MEVQQRKLLYIGLFLLIWGEAANLRFMPECLCYIYHHMAFEVYSVLAGNVSPITGESFNPAYGGDEEAFLQKVVTPIYKVIEKEAEWGKSIKRKHSHWRNYDDLNEYFWSADCFLLGWPMRADADFFRTPRDADPCRVHWMGKVNFVEIRSFCHIFHSFNRMWSFLILSLQAMIIIAWNGGTSSDLFNVIAFKKVLSIFITASILNLGQAILDIAFCWKARRSMQFSAMLRYVLKLISAAIWAVILPVTYGYTWKNKPSLYIPAVIIYLAPNFLSAMLFPFPFLTRLLESSNVKVLIIMMWWSKPRSFVGRGMQEGSVSRYKYTMFWVLLLAMKLSLSFYIEIKPLVQTTKVIISESIKTSQWHEFPPHAYNSICVIIALWAPILMVYFMDTQIWYAFMSSLIGCINGALQGLGTIRTLGMLRAHFKYLPTALDACLTPDANKASDDEERLKISAKFAQTWNLIITSFREEDLVDNREMDLLLVPYCQDRELNIFQWPPFLLASKIPIALDMAANSNGLSYDLKKQMVSDLYFSYAIRECYASFRIIINFLVFGHRERSIVQEIFTVVDKHIEEGSLILHLKMRTLPALSKKFVKLLELLLDNKEEDLGQVVLLFQDMLELVTSDIMKDELQLSRLLNSTNNESNARHEEITSLDQLFTKAIMFPVEVSNSWIEKIKRLHLLFTVNESAMDVPTNLEARRRILFFANSLFMEVPNAPTMRDMLPFSVLTPYYTEDVLFSLNNLACPNEEGVSFLFYLQKIYPDEWKNFLERMGCLDEEQLHEDENLRHQLRYWVSYRGQTLTRTVRGMMYYRKALQFHAFLDTATDDDLVEGYRTTELMTQCNAVADIKFTYVISCQQYGTHKRSRDQRAQDILELMTTYPSLRVAYIDEVEEFSDDRKLIRKVYYSTLAKAFAGKPHMLGQSVDEIIYRIKLPGKAVLGEGKPENQNHALIFTRGECLQTIDVNQEHYMAEALKMRNLLQEFRKMHGVRYPSILGVREHTYTGSVSSLAWFWSNQEATFGTIGQRVLANPLRVRFHYGHSDIFDRLFHITRGGVSKASWVINHNEDIFAGFNSILREGNITHHEYMQVGKGTHTALNDITLFEARIANGTGELTMSRDIYRLGQWFDFIRMLSCYYTTIGFYFSTMITVWTIYVFLYGRLYLVLSGHQEVLAIKRSFVHNTPLKAAIASQSFVQFGFLMVLPMMMEIGLEKGFRTALFQFVLMQLQLAYVFFAFSVGTKSHYYGRTLLHGGQLYLQTRREPGVFHVRFSENYRLYSRSHFVKGIELMSLLVLYEIFGHSPRIFLKISMWFVVGSWLFAPFLFNPSVLEWRNIVDDWTDWNKWINNSGGIGVVPEKSWESWWEMQQDHLQYTGKWGKTVEILLALRFFVYHYGLLSQLNMTKHTRSVLVYAGSWVVFLVIFLLMKTVSISRRRFNVKVQVVFRMIRGLITLIPILVISIRIPHMTVLDIFICIIAFVATGWGLLQIAQVMKRPIFNIGLWGSLKSVAWVYDMFMGLLLFTPVAFVAWFPFMSEFQTRMLFNQAFSIGLQISRILRGQKKDHTTHKKE